ncbi:MAG TPA: RNA 3'-terminal phosphate cyclase [Candidatus Methanomethylicus sp.]|nr:RNA 3'-terminal phosphate cyclase [Candidatus Methanomethylicus sp.]
MSGKNIEIDGAYGEGGGQVLRGAVALSCLTGKAVRVFNIRANRSKPGLQPQHLACIKAAAEVSGAELHGASAGSCEVRFVPGRVAGGSHSFDIKTAGSAMLMVQTLLPIMLAAEADSEVKIIGGTDVPWSPPVDYVRHVVLPGLRSMGVGEGTAVELVRRGHYPKGGGEVVLRTQPARGLRGITATERGAVELVRGVSFCTNLPDHIARRQAQAADGALREAGYANVRVAAEVAREEGGSPGSGVVLWAEAVGAMRIGADALGAREKRAEAVGAEAAGRLMAELGTGMAVDSHMADMIILYMAIAGGASEVGVARLTDHAETMMWLTKEFLGTEWQALKSPSGGAVIRTVGAGLLG